MKWFEEHKSTIKWSIWLLKCILWLFLWLPAGYSRSFILQLGLSLSEIFLFVVPCAVSLAVSFIDCLEKSFYQKINKYMSVFLLDIILLFVSIAAVLSVFIMRNLG